MNQETLAFWRKCSSCKKPIQFGQVYWICSVSTCNRPRTNLAFCNVGCFDSHIPIFNHRDAGAFEKKAPSASEWAQIQAQEASGVTPSTTKTSQNLNEEILVVVSKVKQLIRDSSGMNTSDSLMPVLSDYVRKLSDQAIARANAAGRKTVMERDFD
jgi:histone H3/H4